MSPLMPQDIYSDEIKKSVKLKQSKKGKNDFIINPLLDVSYGIYVHLIDSYLLLTMKCFAYLSIKFTKFGPK